MNKAVRDAHGAKSHGQLHWMDLAASDAGVARDFYAALFGWEARSDRAGEGIFTRLRQNDNEFASIYQLSQKQLQAGVPSHWTPYVSVADLDTARGQVRELGGRVLVKEFQVPGLARIALITDPTGALLGLWESCT